MADDFNFDGFFTPEAGTSTDQLLRDQLVEGPNTMAVRELISADGGSGVIFIPSPSGTRVRFSASLSALLTYRECPTDGVEGTVVTVRTAEGNSTHTGNMVYVLWDHGKFQPIDVSHLRKASTNKKKASSVRMVVADLGDLTHFFQASGNGEEELVHRATKDLWSFKQDGGNYVIERLFDDNGSPLKE